MASKNPASSETIAKVEQDLDRLVGSEILSDFKSTKGNAEGFRKEVASTIRDVEQRTGQKFTKEQRTDLAKKYVGRATQLSPRSEIDQIDYTVAVQQGLGVKPEVPGTVVSSEIDRAVSQGREAGRKEQFLADQEKLDAAKETKIRLEEARAAAGGGGRPGGKTKTRDQQNRDFFLNSGLSRTTADKLIKAGVDPIGGSDSVDMKKTGNLSQKVKATLIEQGFKIKNDPKLSKSTTQGLTAAELRSGKVAHSGTDVAEQRRRAKQGLFRTKKAYERNAKGEVEQVSITPKVTGASAKAAVKNATVGNVKRGLASRARRKETKRLENPAYRAKQIERLAQEQEFTNLEGKLQHESGFSAWYARMKLKVIRFATFHKAWLVFILSAALLFVPWIGLFEWVGYGLAAGAIFVLKGIIFVLASIYNLIASAIVTVITTVGNLFGGTLEAFTQNFLADRGIDRVYTNPSTGEKVDRLFPFTPPVIDTSFPGFGNLNPPDNFDNRTLLDIILGFFGIKFQLFNQIRSLLFRGG